MRILLAFLCGIIFTFVIPKECASEEAAIEVRHLIPPKLEDNNLGEEIICYRPARADSPAMRVDQTEKGKYIAHNYGHGGSGWTLAPGAVAYVVNLLEKKAGEELKKDSEIVIVGAGVFGLFTAFELIERGYTYITIIADQFDDLTSHKAGGFLAPSFMKINNSFVKQVINDIEIQSYQFYTKIAKGEHPLLKKGAVIMTAYLPKGERERLAPYVDAGVMLPPKNVILDFGNGAKRPMIAYDDGIFIETNVIMQFLKDFLLSKKVIFKKDKINTFDDVSSKFVMNCSGLSARELIFDDKMQKVAGHIIRLKNQNPQNLKYMIAVQYDKEFTSQDGGIIRYFYMFPKYIPGANIHDIGIIGGTYIMEEELTSISHKKEFKKVIERAKIFYGLKSSS